MLTITTAPPPLHIVVDCDDEVAARRELRRQVAVLERRLASSGAPSGAIAQAARANPRVLGFEELARTREDLLGQLDGAAEAEAQEATLREAARERLAAMVADPAAHRHGRVALRDLGLPGCGAYYVRPRIGLLGKLASWWEVKLSSGCP